MENGQNPEVFVCPVLPDQKINAEERVRVCKAAFLDACATYITTPKRQNGLQLFLNWLDGHGFYTAPASTKFHGAYRGGLAEHSLDVLEYALKLAPLCELDEEKLPKESIAIAALFHDVCKVDLYQIEMRNQKIDGKWQEVPTYIVNETMPFGGHGSKSVYLISSAMQLKPEEAIAINCHMGFADAPGNNLTPISKAFETYPLAWLIHTADEAATFLRKRAGGK